MIQKSVDVLEFKSEFKRFSNFYPVTIHYNRRTFPTVEHAFVSEKSFDPSFKNRIANLKATQAGYAKKLGRQIQLRDDWDEIKNQVMFELVLTKFNKPEFQSFLLLTGEGKIVEGNYWHDNYWGDCYCKKCQSVMGLNYLGRILMKIRENILCKK